MKHWGGAALAVWRAALLAAMMAVGLSAVSGGAARADQDTWLNEFDERMFKFVDVLEDRFTIVKERGLADGGESVVVAYETNDFTARLERFLVFFEALDQQAVAASLARSPNDFARQDIGAQVQISTFLAQDYTELLGRVSEWRQRTSSPSEAEMTEEIPVADHRLDVMRLNVLLVANARLVASTIMHANGAWTNPRNLERRLDAVFVYAAAQANFASLCWFLEQSEPHSACVGILGAKTDRLREARTMINTATDVADAMLERVGALETRLNASEDPPSDPEAARRHVETLREKHQIAVALIDAEEELLKTLMSNGRGDGPGGYTFQAWEMAKPRHVAYQKLLGDLP